MAALQDLARGWKEDPETLPGSRTVRAHSDADIDVRRRRSRSWRSAGATIPTPRSLLERPPAPMRGRLCADGRRSGSWRAGSDDPETLPVPGGPRPTSDADPDVRRRRSRCWRGGWKRHPETPPFLKERARSDEDNVVRRAAVQELARGWKGHPETLPFLGRPRPLRCRRRCADGGGPGVGAGLEGRPPTRYPP